MKLTRNNVLFYDPEVFGLNASIYYDANEYYYTVPENGIVPKFNTVTGEKFEAILACPDDKLEMVLNLLGKDGLDFIDFQNKLSELK